MVTSFITAFLAGIVSFISPCILPLVPAFLGYLSGVSLTDPNRDRLKVFLNSLSFVLGFSLVFALVGVLLSAFLGSISYSVQVWLSRIGGLIIIFFGLYLTRIIKINWFEREHKLKAKKFSISYVTSFVFGASFAVGWSPCVGAVLGSIFTLALTQPNMAFALLMVYSLGLGLPFLLVGVFSAQSLKIIEKLGKHLKWFNLIVGIILIILGILVFTQTLNRFAYFGFTASWL